MASQATEHLKAVVSDNIVRAMAERPGVTNRDIARRLDATEGMVSKWRRGKHIPSSGNLIALAGYLDLDPSWFYEDRREQVAA